jgi:hypothetical protein
MDYKVEAALRMFWRNRDFVTQYNKIKITSATLPRSDVGTNFVHSFFPAVFNVIPPYLNVSDKKNELADGLAEGALKGLSARPAQGLALMAWLSASVSDGAMLGEMTKLDFRLGASIGLTLCTVHHYVTSSTTQSQSCDIHQGLVVGTDILGTQTEELTPVPISSPVDLSATKTETRNIRWKTRVAKKLA